MARCYWEMKIVQGSSMFALIFDFSHAEFSTVRKMQVLYDAASELAAIFISQGISCFIGVGPVDEESIQEAKKWQLVLIPDENGELTSPEQGRREKKVLLETLISFLQHLNQTPAHYLPLVKSPNRNTDIRLN